MSLLVPLALLGLLTVPFIILLHLLRSRRKPIAISSLRLWRDLQQKKQGALPRSIPLSLMLILQLIVATALTLALARPASSFFLDQPEQIIFILDTTTSMAATDATVAGNSAQRFEAAREQIQNHIQNMDDNDRTAVINLSGQPELLLTANAGEKETALQTLQTLTPGGSGNNLTAALTLANGLVDSEQVNQIVVLTDGNFVVEPQTLPSALAPIDWQLIGDQPDSGNQALLNVSSRRMPDGRYRVFARVVNFNDAPVSRTIQLFIDGSPVDETTLEIDPQSDVVQVWTVTSQAETVAVEIVEPDLLPLDNRAELSLLGTARRRVLLLSDTSDTLRKTFEAQPNTEVTVKASNYQEYDSDEFDLIVFDSLPPEQTDWPKGSVLVVNPPLGHPLLPAQNFARDLRPDLETTSALLTDIDLSGVYFNRVPDLSPPDWAEVDLWTQNPNNANADAALESDLSDEIPLIFHGSVGNSRIMVWTFDLNASNLPARLALPLLTANAMTTLLTPAPMAAVLIGEPVLLAGNYSVELPDGRRLVSGTADDAVFTRTKQPGLYKIYSQNDAPIGGFAVHAGSPFESNLNQQLELDALSSIDAGALPAPDIEIAFDEFWPFLAALAVVVVTFEGWLAWRK